MVLAIIHHLTIPCGRDQIATVEDMGGDGEEVEGVNQRGMHLPVLMLQQCMEVEMAGTPHQGDAMVVPCEDMSVFVLTF